jgi:hypothetical protein
VPPMSMATTIIAALREGAAQRCPHRLEGMPSRRGRL